MPVGDRELREAFEALDIRLRNIEGTLRRLESQEGRWNMTSGLLPAAASGAGIREMFLLEILRQKGVLDGIDLEPITEKVTQQLADKDIPWAASKETATHHVASFQRWIADDYSSVDDDD